MGNAAEARDADPILNTALILPKDGEAVGDWYALARRLAGTSLLNLAVSTMDAAKGPLVARQEAAEAALLSRYGPLLGETGALAAVEAAAKGVGGLRRSELVRVWSVGLALALLVGLIAGLWAVRQMATPDAVGALLLHGLLMGLGVGLIAAIATAVAARLVVGRLNRRMGLTGARTLTISGLILTVVGLALAPVPVMLVTAVGAYYLDRPKGFRVVVQSFLETPEPATARTTTALRIRVAPDLAAEVITTLPEGSEVVLGDETRGDWTEVSYGGRMAWAATRYLAFDDPEPTTP